MFSVPSSSCFVSCCVSIFLRRLARLLIVESSCSRTCGRGQNIYSMKNILYFGRERKDIELESSSWPWCSLLLWFRSTKQSALGQPCEDHELLPPAVRWSERMWHLRNSFVCSLSSFDYFLFSSYFSPPFHLRSVLFFIIFLFVQIQASPISSRTRFLNFKRTLSSLLLAHSFFSHVHSIHDNEDEERRRRRRKKLYKIVQQRVSIVVGGIPEIPSTLYF